MFWDIFQPTSLLQLCESPGFGSNRSQKRCSVPSGRQKNSTYYFASAVPLPLLQPSACTCACVFVCMYVWVCVHAGGRLQLTPLTLFRCVRSCALRGALRSAELRLRETTTRSACQRRGRVFCARACLLVWDGSCTVVMFVRFVSESFLTRRFFPDQLGQRPSEAPRLNSSGFSLKGPRCRSSRGRCGFAPALSAEDTNLSLMF